MSDLAGYVDVLDGRGASVAFLDAGEGTAIEGVAFSPDGRLIAGTVTEFASPLASRVQLWDWEREELVGTLKTAGPVTLTFAPDGSTLAVGTFDGAVEVWDIETQERRLTFPASSGAVGDIAYSPDGTRIATAGEDGTARLFDAATGREQLVLRGHTYLVTGIAFSPDGSRLATAAPDGLVRVWTLDLDELIHMAETRVTRGLSDDECRQYLHQPDGCA